MKDSGFWFGGGAVEFSLTSLGLHAACHGRWTTIMMIHHRQILERGERTLGIGKDAQFGMRNSHNGPLNIERRKELSLKYELSWMHLYPSLSVEERM